MRHRTLHKSSGVCAVITVYSFMTNFWANDNTFTETWELLRFCLTFLPSACTSLPSTNTDTPCVCLRKHSYRFPFIVVAANTSEQCKVNLSVLLEQLNVNLEKHAMPRLNFIQISLSFSSSGFHTVVKIWIDMQMKPIGWLNNNLYPYEQL